MRELTIVGHVHPVTLPGGYTLVEHPGLNVLTEGDAALGWAGDPRLAVYLHAQNQNFVLFRLEHDNEYRPVAKLPEGRSLNGPTVNQLVKRLVEHDTRTGFDPLADVERTQEQLAKAAATRRRDFIEDYADKLHFALARSYLPGVNIVRPRQLIKKV